MNTRELRDILNARGIVRSAYSLTGGNPNEAYVLDHDKTGWSVYYSERGIRTGEKRYETEHEACEALLAKLLEL